MHPHRIKFHKYRPGESGKAEMCYYHLEKNQSFFAQLSTRINCGHWSVSRHGSTLQKTDVVWLDCYRVLGEEKLPKQPVIVSAKLQQKD